MKKIMRRTTMSERKQVFASNCKFQIKKHYRASNIKQVTDTNQLKLVFINLFYTQNLVSNKSFFINSLIRPMTELEL